MFVDLANDIAIVKKSSLNKKDKDKINTNRKSSILK